LHLSQLFFGSHALLASFGYLFFVGCFFGSAERLKK
jgi:hypothetical protein